MMHRSISCRSKGAQPSAIQGAATKGAWQQLQVQWCVKGTHPSLKFRGAGTGTMGTVASSTMLSTCMHLDVQVSCARTGNSSLLMPEHRVEQGTQA